MKWKQYEELDDELKEEYNYKFKKDHTNSLIGLASAFSIFTLSLGLLILLTYIVINNSSVFGQETGYILLEQLRNFSTYSNWILILGLIFIIRDFVKMVVREVYLVKWKKENFIETQGWWKFWEM